MRWKNEQDGNHDSDYGSVLRIPWTYRSPEKVEVSEPRRQRTQPLDLARRAQR